MGIQKNKTQKQTVHGSIEQAHEMARYFNRPEYTLLNVRPVKVTFDVGKQCDIYYGIAYDERHIHNPGSYAVTQGNCVAGEEWLEPRLYLPSPQPKICRKTRRVHPGPCGGGQMYHFIVNGDMNLQWYIACYGCDISDADMARMGKAVHPFGRTFVMCSHDQRHYDMNKYDDFKPALLGITVEDLP